MEINKNKVSGASILAVGLLLLFAQVTGFTIMSLLWPAWIIAPGLAFLYFAFKDDKAHLGFAIPGTIITGTGLILAFMNAFGHWEAWSYVWALYPALVGFAFLKVGELNMHEAFEKTGSRLIQMGLYMFIGFGIFFEAFVFGGITSAIVPIALIGIGVLLMYSKNGEVKLPAKAKRKVSI